MADDDGGGGIGAVGAVGDGGGGGGSAPAAPADTGSTTPVGGGNDAAAAGGSMQVASLTPNDKFTPSGDLSDQTSATRSATPLLDGLKSNYSNGITPTDGNKTDAPAAADGDNKDAGGAKQTDGTDQTQDLKRGDGMGAGQSDPKVADLQKDLKAAGFDVGKFGKNHDGVDGKFGPKTEAAVKKAQEKMGLPPTGVADQKTMDALKNYKGQEQPPAATDPKQPAAAADPKQPAATGPAGVLADSRQRFAQEMANNKDLSRLLAASTKAEVGGQGRLAEQQYMESVMNRAQATGRSLQNTLTNGAYYPASTTNKLGAQFSPAQQNYYNGIANQVLNGSNVSNLATGNESGRVRSGGAQITANPGTGERFVAELNTVKWRNNMLQQLRNSP